MGWHSVAVVQHTFTHEQYTEQHNEAQYNHTMKHNTKQTIQQHNEAQYNHTMKHNTKQTIQQHNEA